MKKNLHLWFGGILIFLCACSPESVTQPQEKRPNNNAPSDSGVFDTYESLDSGTLPSQSDAGGTETQPEDLDAGMSIFIDAGDFEPQWDSGTPTSHNGDAGQIHQEVTCAQTTLCSNDDDCCTPGCTNDQDSDCDNATVISIQPYLQNPRPTSMWILWETEDDGNSRVNWGTTDQLENTATGDSFSPFLSGHHVHEVLLDDLEPDTLYFYQVQTENTFSAIYHFVTTTTGDSEAPTRLVAMSDMQQDSSNPDKFRELVEEGILPFVAQEWPEADLTDLLDLVLVPGDLVDSGLFISQFRNTFFAPSEKLLSYVPVLPVLGNHEANSQYYFDLFHLPEQASGGNKEHWWHSDHSNLRVIGLDSNRPYNNNTQLQRLEDTLDNACDNNAIDFVFTEIHHPAKSELWPVGESDFTSDVVERMENFTASCDKPSIHFFGHTHGYSRGQSRDHRHLWVNVASAGGNLDYWDEYNQTDYEEFNVSLDEYGFVLVDVEAGADPSFYLRRISRGDEDTTINNEIKDEIRVRRYNQSPQAPTGISPMGTGLCLWDLSLSASSFNDPDTNDLHGASHWQVSNNCDNFDSPLWESWRQHENWYRDEDLQAGDDLTDEEIISLAANSTYCWRVRYRDRGLVWSPWSQAISFSTVGGSGNLLENPGAEFGLISWSTTAGHHESLLNGQCNGISPHSGLRYFAVGGLCDSASYAQAVQEVHVPESLYEEIDSGLAKASYGGYLSNYNGDDHPEIKLVFKGGDQSVLGESESIGSFEDTWTLTSAIHSLPPLTRHIDMVLMGTRNSGSDNDSYFDDLFLEVSACQ